MRRTTFVKFVFASLCILGAWATPAMSQPEMRSPGCGGRCAKNLDCRGSVCSSCVSQTCIHLTLPPDGTGAR